MLGALGIGGKGKTGNRYVPPDLDEHDHLYGENSKIRLIIRWNTFCLPTEEGKGFRWLNILDPSSDEYRSIPCTQKVISLPTAFLFISVQYTLRSTNSGLL